MPERQEYVKACRKIITRGQGWKQARRHGGHYGAVPPQMTACAPPNEHCAPPREDCATKKLTVSGLLECKSRPKTSKFARILRRQPEFEEILGRKPFFFFLVFTSEFVKNRKDLETTTRICGNFETKTFFELLVPPCPHRLHINKLLMPPQNLFLPPQSRCPGAGPGWKSIIRKKVKNNRYSILQKNSKD